MTTWTDQGLEQVGKADELQLASRRPDGSLRPYVTMWVVRVCRGLYLRSAGGPDRPSFRHALASGTGRIRASGVEVDVTFGQVADDARTAIDDAHQAKYDSYGSGIVGSVVRPDAHCVTIRLLDSSGPQPDGHRR